MVPIDEAVKKTRRKGERLVCFRSGILPIRTSSSGSPYSPASTQNARDQVTMPACE
jgi:hypothetical protein